jgi:hypothetical protein
LCEVIWPGADGAICIFTLPHLVIIMVISTVYCFIGLASSLSEGCRWHPSNSVYVWKIIASIFYYNSTCRKNLKSEKKLEDNENVHNI